MFRVKNNRPVYKEKSFLFCLFIVWFGDRVSVCPSWPQLIVQLRLIFNSAFPSLHLQTTVMSPDSKIYKTLEVPEIHPQELMNRNIP